jgi:phospholipase/carboxylesterase
MLSSYHHTFQPAQAANAPTLLLLHGTGGNEHDLLPLGRQLQPQAALLSPRGNVLENGMPRFFRRLAMGVFDLDDLRLRTAQLAAFVAAAAEHYGFDRERVIALGYSNGANIAASLLLLQPQTLAAAALLHAMVPLVPLQLPQLSGRRVLLTAGRRDPLVPAANTQQLADLLTQAGAAVTLHWENGGHQISNDELTQVAAWFTGATALPTQE